MYMFLFQCERFILINVYRRKERNNQWWVYFRYPDQDNPLEKKIFRRKAPVQIKREAEKWGMKMLTHYCEQIGVQKKVETPTLNEFSETYLEDYVKNQLQSIYL